MIIIIYLLYLFNLENNEQAIVNNSINIFSNIQIDNSSNESATINFNSTKNYDKNFNKNKKNEKIFNNSSDEALEAKRGVEKYALGKNEIAGYPIYKDKRLNAWLVPIFDKKTKKFKESVYIYNGG